MTFPFNLRRASKWLGLVSLACPILLAAIIVSSASAKGPQPNISITALPTTITQNFDTLPATGTGFNVLANDFGVYFYEAQPTSLLNRVKYATQSPSLQYCPIHRAMLARAETNCRIQINRSDLPVMKVKIPSFVKR